MYKYCSKNFSTVLNENLILRFIVDVNCFCEFFLSGSFVTLVKKSSSIEFELELVLGDDDS